MEQVFTVSLFGFDRSGTVPGQPHHPVRFAARSEGRFCTRKSARCHTILATLGSFPRFVSPILFCILTSMTNRLSGFRGEFLWELDIATRQTIAMAERIAAEKYDWRPDSKARSCSEVFVHVAAGNFMLLDVIGVRRPKICMPKSRPMARRDFWTSSAGMTNWSRASVKRARLWLC